MTEILQLMVDNVQQKKFNVMTIFFFKHQILLSFSQILKKKDTGTQWSSIYLKMRLAE